MKPERRPRPWIPALILGLGCLMLLAAKREQPMPLVRELAAVIPDSILGQRGLDQVINAEELKISGVSSYLLRSYGIDSTNQGFSYSVYIGYYEAQVQGKTLHSPKNCLPGAGWEPIASERIRLNVAGYSFPINRYVIAKGGTQAVVYYWYQGRGRIAANEYTVKLELMRDRALTGRSDESLVRVVVPFRSQQPMAAADSVAAAVSRALIPRIFAAIPGQAGRTVPQLAP